jgi:hypothetical protein
LKLVNYYHPVLHDKSILLTAWLVKVISCLNYSNILKIWSCWTSGLGPERSRIALHLHYNYAARCGCGSGTLVVNENTSLADISPWL